MSDTPSMNTILTPEERPLVVEILKEQAFTIRQGCDYCEHTCGEQRVIVHALAGPFGADWDLAEAVAYVVTADVVAWVQGHRGHELGAEKDGRVVYFQVSRPT